MAQGRWGVRYTVDPREQKFCSRLSFDSLLNYKKEVEDHTTELLRRKVVDFGLYKYLMGTRVIIRHQIIERLSE